MKFFVSKIILLTWSEKKFTVWRKAFGFFSPCRKMLRLVGRFVSIIFLVVVAIACSPGSTPKMRVAVTIPPLQNWAQQLVGDRIEVVCAVPDGGNPESYDLPPAAMVELSQCRLYFSCGYLGFERSWLDKLVANNPEIRVEDLSKGISLIYGTHHHHAEVAEHVPDEADGPDLLLDEHSLPDPHVWCSPRLARQMVETMFRALVELDPEGADLYTANFVRLDSSFVHLDSLLTRRLAPYAGRAFAVYHPTLTYWAVDYGLQQLSLEPDGKTPSPHYLRMMVDSALRVGVDVVFIQREFDSRQAETFAREVGCRTEVINPLAYDWNDELMRIADAFTQR